MSRLCLELTPEGVEQAYRLGIFPMADDRTDEILWFRPDPRAVIPLDHFHVSRSLARTIRRGKFDVRINTNFEGVMHACADRQEGTWINEDFIEVYTALHRKGKAHSVEVYLGDRLVGGTYGVALGAAFMAESMFHYETDASKVALYYLIQRLKERGIWLLDVQYLTPHLERMGAVVIPHSMYDRCLNAALQETCTFA